MGMPEPSTCHGDGLRSAAESAMQRRLRVAEDFHLSYVYLCTHGNPTPELAGHWGENIEIVKGVLQSSMPPRIFAEMAGDLAKASTGDMINILFLCNSGRHRSIAMSKFVEYILQREGIPSRPVVHVSRCRWPENVCTSCQMCGAFSEPERRQLQAKAFEMWSEVKAEVSS